MDTQTILPPSQLETERAKSKEMKRPSLEEWIMKPTTHPIMDSHGYVLHPGIQVLLCMVCKSGVTPDNVKSHCERNAGHEYVRKEDRDFIQQLAGDCRFGDREGRLPEVAVSGTLPPLEGFETFLAYQCPTCGKLYKELRSIQRHFSGKHRPELTPTFRQVPAQYLFKGKYGILFAVDPRNDSIPVDSLPAATARIAQNLQFEIAQKLHDEHSANWTDKDAWPYLRDVPWHEVLEANHENFTVSQLKSFITIPPIHTTEANGTLAKALALAVENVVFSLEKDVEKADYQAMQWLGSDSGRYVLL
ncbi:hypothetical protein QFC19_001440 [Naganishia cerealis]|uniref:Uncharacterized protein n=1 Tax=Naganishia cerealis TaxID=610337 RepID=A0ACC2WHP8_9TREE|nr:hypothetical protein QFC19_001440 [Naganishia cerealis]